MADLWIWEFCASVVFSDHIAGTVLDYVDGLSTWRSRTVSLKVHYQFVISSFYIWFSYYKIL
ncbi:hypothetical protein V6Z11_A07G021600 [Gossypium hirsutum]